MPPKPKFTKNEIVAAALQVVSEKGTNGLTAREVGDALGSSARPIFTVFKNMEELKEEVKKAAMQKFEDCAKHTLSGMPKFKQIGMQMVLFGMQEPKLYQLLFMEENEQDMTFDDVFGHLGATAEVCIKAIQSDYALSLPQAKTLFENVWIYTFGVGALCATKMCRFSEEKISQMLTTEFLAMMMLVKSENR